MNAYILCLLLFGVFQIAIIKGFKVSTKSSQITSGQVVKTCCGDAEVFNIVTNNCESMTKSKLANATKSDLLYPYLGNWKTKRKPRVSHVPPVCGFDDYTVVELKKRVSLSAENIEISKSDEYSISFEYYKDYCIELTVNNTSITMADESSFTGVIRITCLSYPKQKKCGVRLCCPLKEIYDQELNTCKPKNRKRNPDAYTILDNVPRYNSETLTISHQQVDTTFVFSDGSDLEYSPGCLSRQERKTGRKELILYENGEINVNGNDLDFTEYCISDIKSDSSSTSNYTAWIMYCEYPSWYRIWSGYVGPVLYIISNVFLVVLLVYTLMEKGSKVFGAMIVAITFNLLICYLGITVAKLWGRNIHHRSSRICFIDGVVIYFSYLSVMFWLNALCFDVWSSFHSMRAPKMLRVNDNKFDGFMNYKFRRYAVYGWGIPIIVTTIALTMEFLPSEYTAECVTPRFGEENCFLGSKLARLYYQFIPAGIALLLSMVLFGCFVWNLCCGLWANQSGDPSVR